MAADPFTEVSYVARHETLAAVLVPGAVRRLGPEAVEADLVYCSCSGPPQAHWFEPDANDHLEALATGRPTDGHLVERPGSVVVAPFDFIFDHMGAALDLDTGAVQTIHGLGMPYAHATIVGTHPAPIDSLTDIPSEWAAAAYGEDIRPGSTIGVGPFRTVYPDSCCQNGAGRLGWPAYYGIDGDGSRQFSSRQPR